MPSVTDGSMYNLPYSISYHVGYDLVMDIEAEIVAKRGKAYLRSNRRRLQQIMLTGAWSVKLFKRWVKFALNRPDQFDTYVEEQVKTWSERSRRPRAIGKGFHAPPSALIPRGFDLEGYRGARLFK
jgi:acyl carrier protein phosphodiesterase